MTISYLTVLFCIPLPRHDPQKSFILVPSPLQELHVDCITNGPCLIVCPPVPLHALHFWGCVPGLHLLPLHVSHLTVFAYSTDYSYLLNYLSCSKHRFTKINRHVHYTCLIWGLLSRASSICPTKHLVQNILKSTETCSITALETSELVKHILLIKSSCTLTAIRWLISRSSLIVHLTLLLIRENFICTVVKNIKYLLTSANFSFASGLEFLSGCSYCAIL